MESELVDDPASVNGKAVRMPGNYRNWSVQVPLEQIYDTHAKWRVHFDLRCEGAGNDGGALTCGLYDALGKKDIWKAGIAISQIRGERYTTISSPPLELPKNNLLIYVQPWGRPENELKAIWVDRIYLTRE